VRKAVEIGRLTGLAYLVVFFWVLSWAKDFLLPVILATLISFLLTPAVSRLQRWGLHPGLAVLSTVAIAFALIGAVLTTVSVQAVDLVNALPKYRDNIEAKWVAIQKGPRALMHELTGMQLSVKTAEELIVPTIRTIENELFPGSAAIQTKSRIYERMRTAWWPGRHRKGSTPFIG